MRRAGIFIAVLIGSVAATTVAIAQSYPTRPITMIVPLAAGGATDMISRIVAEHMKTTLGQPIVIDNVPTAAGTVGVARAARAAPDGYTLSAGDQTSFVMSSITNPVQYDTVRDFAPISLLSTSPVVFLGKSSLPQRNLRDLIGWLRENPGKASLATFGQGSGPHIVGAAFQLNTATRMQAVPYRGTPPALQDLIAGQVDVMFAELATALPHIRDRNVQAFAVLASARSAAAPEIPTIEEAGGPALHITTWRGLWTPQGTPPGIIEKLNAAVVDALTDPKIQQRVAELGQELPPRAQMNPQALAAHHRAEREKWLTLIKAVSETGR
jgi:tripartite-type tricarboxylate transporter receptor subunit TctC